MTILKNFIKATLALSFMSLFAAAGYAQQESVWTVDFQKAFQTEKMMHMMDMSGKGMVSKADYDMYMGKVFDMMDKKHKGMLDKDDYTHMESGSTDLWTTDFQRTFRTVAMMHMMDKSGKGMVTKAEFMAHMDKIFDMLDKNHDGMLEKSEFMYAGAFGVK